MSPLVALFVLHVLTQASTTEPRWVIAPAFHPQDYPAVAELLGIASTVRLRCTGHPDGSVTGCAAVGPVGGARFGFEASAASIVQRGRVQPSEDGSTFEVEVPFVPRNASTVERYNGPEPDAFALADQNRAVHRSVSDTGYDWSFAMDDLDPAEQRRLRPFIRQAYREFRDDWRRGYVLALARETELEALAAAREGREPLEYGYTHRHDAAYDQLNLVEIQIRDRARSLYCAAYDCPAE